MIRVLAALALLATAGCNADPIDWRIRFARAADRDAADWIHARVHRDSCDGEAIYDERIARGQAATMSLEPLGTGTWAFDVLAIDADCRVVARTCDLIELPTDRDEVVTTLEMFNDPTPGCPGQCVAGRCGGGLDGGVLDGGRDAGPGLSAPTVLWPINGTVTGSALTPVSGTAVPYHPLLPQVRWASVPAAASFVVELAACTAPDWRDCALQDPLPFYAGAGETSAGPTDPLAVDEAAPLGRRYVFRVGACAAAGGVDCAYSPTRYVDVGRVLQDTDGDGRAEMVAAGRIPTEDQLRRFSDGGGHNAFWEARAALGPAAWPGDYDADGRAELLVRDATLSSVVVLSGDAVLGEVSGDVADGFGESLSGVGDVDGDGYADFAVGAPAEGAGAVHVFRGGPTFDATRRLAPLTGSGAGGFGIAVARAGDWDQDGNADVAVLERGAAGASVHLRIYALSSDPPRLLHEQLNIDAGVLAEPTTVSLTGGRDMDGDGYPEVALGLPGASRVLVLFSHGAGQPVTERGQSFATPFFGQTVVTADFEGDGRAEIITGLPSFSPGAGAPANQGAIVKLSPQADDLHAVVYDIRDFNNADNFQGWEVMAGDIDGDGLDELAGVQRRLVGPGPVRGLTVALSPRNPTSPDVSLLFMPGVWGSIPQTEPRGFVSTAR